MIPNGKGWCYLAVKKIALLRGIRSKSNDNFNCFNCLIPFE